MGILAPYSYFDMNIIFYIKVRILISEVCLAFIIGALAVQLGTHGCD